MDRSIRTLRDVVGWRMCAGCGACSAVCAEGGVELANIRNEGIRPRFRAARGLDCEQQLSICPGYHVEAPAGEPFDENVAELGTTLEVWEGYAADSQIRFQASSGGLLTALSLFCLERLGMEFVLHAGMEPERPWLNATHQSRSREDLLRHTGSRYAPSSPCDALRHVEAANGQCVLVVKPCDAAGVAMMRRQRPALDRHAGLVLTFFCAGTPSTDGTLDLLSEMGVKVDELSSLRYRGEGWPGGFKPTLKEGNQKFMRYSESWSKLTGHRPLRCHLCPDGLGRVADISCGDAWHRYAGQPNPGRSLILVRTPFGRRVVAEAVSAGYLHLHPSGVDDVRRAQTDLLRRRRQLHGRLLAFRLLGLPVPCYEGFGLRRSFKLLPARERLSVVVGTLRRILTNGWWRRYRPVWPEDDATL